MRVRVRVLGPALARRVPTARRAAIGPRRLGQTTVDRDHRALTLATAQRARRCRGGATAHHVRRGGQLKREAHGPSAPNALIAPIVPSRPASVHSLNVPRKPMPQPLRPRWR